MNKIIQKLICLSLFFAGVFSANNVFSQVYNCGNVGVEDSTFTGWQGYIGSCAAGTGNNLPTLTIPNTTVTFTTPQTYIDASSDTRFAIMTPDSGVNGYDPLIPLIPVVSPWGGTRSIRIGNSQSGSDAERLRFNYTVDATNANFVYQYAVLLEDAGHLVSEQPAFRIKITNAAGTVLNPTCGIYNVSAGQGGVGFNSYLPVGAFDSISYRNWSLSSIDLTPYIGTTIKIEFTTNDCSLGGHYGYAYVDASCQPLQLTTSYCSGATTAEVTGPDGYIGYSWTANANVNYPPPTGPNVNAGSVITSNSAIFIPSYDTLTTYTVELIPYQGFACSTTLDYIFNPVATLVADFSFLTYCGNTPSVFTDASLVQNNGAPINQYQWYFGDGDSSDVANPIHNYPVLTFDTTYTVILIAHAGLTCQDTVILPVTVPSGLTIDSTSAGLGIIPIGCFGGNDGEAHFTVSGSNGAPIQYFWTVPPTNSSIDGNIDNLAANTASGMPLYWFRAIDPNSGCTDSVSFVITEPPAINATIPVNYSNCAQDTGSLFSTVSGGTGALSIQWNTFPQQSGNAAHGIYPGPYNITVVDANNCSTIAFGTLLNGSSLAHTLVLKNLSCHGIPDGEASIQLSGGKPPYSIEWHIGNNVPIAVGSDNDTISNLDRSNNYVILHNDNDCLDDTIPFTIFEPDTLRGLMTSTNTACLVAQNGAIKVDAIGGTPPYRYNWNTNANTKAITNLPQGIYNVDILDTNNCIINVVGTVGYDSNFVVMAKPDFVYEKNSANTLAVAVERQSDYAGEYTYLWNNGIELNDNTIAAPIMREIFFPLSFRVDVMDEFGCAGFDSMTVETTPIIYVPTAFSPNEDGLNESFQLGFDTVAFSNFNINIYDRWGQIIFQSSSPRFKWNGKMNNGDSVVGMYNYNISYTDNRNKKQFINGILTMLK